MVQSLWKFLKKLKIELPYDPALPLLGIYPKKMKTGYQRHICTPIFITALFIIANIWKQSKCPLMDEWTKKMWYIYIYTHIHTLGYYSAMKNKDMLPFATTWIDL